jgi:hypothetical protein
MKLEHCSPIKFPVQFVIMPTVFVGSLCSVVKFFMKEIVSPKDVYGTSSPAYFQIERKSVQVDPQVWVPC